VAQRFSTTSAIEDGPYSGPEVKTAIPGPISLVSLFRMLTNSAY